jgi:golgi phosphoprotein 3
MYLHEEVLLLALKDDSGKIDWGAGHFHMVMAGAVIAELLLAERISVDEKKLVTLLDGAPHENAVLNQALQFLAAAKRRRKIQHWIGKLAVQKDLKQMTAAALCDQGILKAEEAKVLFVFNKTTYPELNPGPERQLIARLKHAIFSDGNEVDARTGLLISLTYPSGMLAIPFAAKELRKRKKRIKQITEGELVGKATADAIAATQAIIAAVAVMPVITAASSAGAPGC